MAPAGAGFVGDQEETMFGNKDRAETPAVPAGGGTREKRVNSVLGEGATFTGTLRVGGTLVLNGEFEGTLTVGDSLVVGKSGHMKADADVQTATIAGRVEGRIFAKDRVELQTGAHFRGDVHAKSFVIQDGVFFQGNCSMGEAQRESQDPKDAAGGSKPDLGILKQT